MINLIFDKIDGKPLQNGRNNISPLGEYIGAFHQINLLPNISLKSIDEIDFNRTNLYLIELMYYDFGHVLDQLNPVVVEIIKTHNISILIYFPTEGYRYDIHDWWLDRIQAQLTDYGLEKNKKFLVFSSTEKNDEFYRSHVNKIKDGSLVNKDSKTDEFWNNSLKSVIDKVFGLFHFEFLTIVDGYIYQLPSLKHPKHKFVRDQILSPLSKKVDFISYNRNLRPHRLAIVSELHRLKLDKKSFISLIGYDHFPKPSEYNLNFAKKFLPDSHSIEYFEKFYNSWKPMYMKYEDENYKMFEGNITHFRLSYFSLITETEFDEETLYITEKTFKVINHYHPFILFGSPGTLERLRCMGYQTFPELFDESYDKELDTKTRMGMIIEQIQKFSSLSQEEKAKKLIKIKPKLIHNKKNLYDRQKTYHRDFEKMFLDMSNIINDQDTKN